MSDKRIPEVAASVVERYMSCQKVVTSADGTEDSKDFLRNAPPHQQRQSEQGRGFHNQRLIDSESAEIHTHDIT